MTVDVEDYFQVSAFQDIVPRNSWDDFDSRVCRNTERLLEIFDEFGVRATFFVLGWVADRFPALVQAIVSQGHEVASHGYDHQLVYDNTPQHFRTDLHRARSALESASGHQVRGYRAPSYSITRRSLWALDVLIEEGYEYDASIYPIFHDRYGIPDAPRHAHKVERPGGEIWEVPGSTIRYARTNMPIGGGGYFRLFPAGWTRWGIRHLNDVEGMPAIFYLHPWELDPGQPRLPASLISRFRHYRNLGSTESRLRQLLKEFAFGPMTELLESREPSKADEATVARRAG